MPTAFFLSSLSLPQLLSMFLPFHVHVYMYVRTCVRTKVCIVCGGQRFTWEIILNWSAIGIGLSELTDSALLARQLVGASGALLGLNCR